MGSCLIVFNVDSQLDYNSEENKRQYIVFVRNIETEKNKQEKKLARTNVTRLNDECVAFDIHMGEERICS
jgi:hypothetical protein